MTNSSDNLNTNNSLENVVSFNCHMNVHAYSLQRPSVFIDQQVDVHVINTSHDFNNDETSLQDNLISQQYNDNISQDTHVFNTLSTAELSSTPVRLSRYLIARLIHMMHHYLVLPQVSVLKAPSMSQLICMITKISLYHKVHLALVSKIRDLE